MLPVQLDVSARDPSLDPLASVPDLNSLFLCFLISISLTLSQHFCLFLPPPPLSLPFSLSRI